jgi:NAD(P)H-flavin reductase
MSMISHLSSTSTLPPNVEFLYSVNAAASSDVNGTDAAEILFYERLREIASSNADRVKFKLFITGKRLGIDFYRLGSVKKGRIIEGELLRALGSEDKDVLKRTVCFVCGPPEMTDSVVAFLEKQGARTYCEKWW